MKLLVIDGNSIVNRAFFGMHPLNNREGFPTHAIFGFLNILRRMEKAAEPGGLCAPSPLFRISLPDRTAGYGSRSVEPASCA